jgi:starch-binding outer membrane protein, SusD/RagB family
MKKILYSFIFILFTIVFWACGDSFLDRVPEGELTVDSYYKNEKELRQATAPLYNVAWFQYNEKASIGLGDAMGGNILGKWTTNLYMFYRFTVTTLNTDLANAWKALYRVVDQSNFVIYNIKTYSSGVTEDQKNLAIAEARFMRANAYFYLVRLWGPVMIIENTNELISDYKIPLNNVDDVYKFIIRDLEFAIKHLKTTDDPGRVTQWSAKGMLAKVYLTYAGYGQNGTRKQELLDKAAELAGDVCNNSGLELTPIYKQLFMTQYENTPETLFALQWVYGTWGAQNDFQAYYAYSSDITGAGDGWGGGNGPSYDLIAEFEKDPKDTIRRNATCFMEGNHYPEINKKKGGTTFALTNPKIKKYIVGTADDNNGEVASMQTGINTYILRLSDVYLIYAEALLGNNASTTNAEALKYFNKVRTRAGVDTKSSITWEDIFHERRVELGIEAQAWYDIVRWYYYQPTQAKEFINTQYRDYDFTWTRNTGLVLGAAPDQIVKAPTSMFLPIPESDVVQNPLLSQPPVPYVFSNEE